VEIAVVVVVGPCTEVTFGPVGLLEVLLNHSYVIPTSVVPGAVAIVAVNVDAVEPTQTGDTVVGFTETPVTHLSWAKLSRGAKIAIKKAMDNILKIICGQRLLEFANNGVFEKG
jgi:hypothetical protein